MMLLCVLFSSGAYAQQGLQASEAQHPTLYPYRDKSGNFGYVDDSLRVHIPPQYKMASHFTEQGFAVVTDSLDRKGVIDKSNNRIVPAEYEHLRLIALEDFTLAEVYSVQYTRWRFWDWDFLPGFSILGSSGDGRLFDTKVKRIKKAVIILGNKPKKVLTERLTDKGYVDKYFDIRPLDGNQVLVDDRLYAIRAKGAHFIASGVKEPLTQQTFAQQKGQRLHIIDRKGKRIKGSTYLAVDSIPLQVEEKPVMIPLSSSRAIAGAYQNDENLTFIYPDFSKPLPRYIHANTHPGDLTAEELIRGLWLLAPVQKSDFFLFMSFRDGERFFRFLDTHGNWHQTLPADIPFTVVRPSGDILWSAEKHDIPQDQVPEGWKIDRMSSLSDSPMYHIALRRDKTVRHGIWDSEEKRWLIAPEYYEVYAMDNGRQWRYHSEYGGLWGIMDYNGKVVIKPTYSSLHPDGWVTRQENGESISFYLHPQTLEELREK